MRRTGWVILGMSALAALAPAIVPNNGIDNNFTGVGRRWIAGNPGSVGSFVAIGKRVLLTARHVGVTQFVSFDQTGAGGSLVELDQPTAMNIGTADLMLVRTKTDLPTFYGIDFNALSSPFTHQQNADGSISFFNNPGGVASDLTAVGFGGSGVVNGAGTAYAVNIAAGQRRSGAFRSDSRGMNTIGGIGPYNTVMDFLLANGEGALAGGDSGGGLFRQDGSSWKLVGINVAASTNYMFATDGTINTLQHINVFAELAQHRAAIEAYLVPEPASMAALGLGLAVLIRRRRK